jgi:hypothetical protein
MIKYLNERGRDVTQALFAICFIQVIYDKMGVCDIMGCCNSTEDIEESNLVAGAP